MSSALDDRVLALAGVAQALQQVRRIAETGQSEASTVRTAVGSVFRIDAGSTAEVYGSAQDVAPGLRLLHNYLSSRGSDDVLPRLALAVLQLERRFIKEADVTEQVAIGVRRASARAAALDNSIHPEVLSMLGGLYSETLSKLRPRVMVQGNPHYLGQAAVVSEIRTLLLAAVRSAVLWRQLGGSWLDFIFKRRAMAAAIEDHLR